MTSTRFSFEIGEKLDRWPELAEQALSVCDNALLSGASTDATADLVFEALQLVFHASVHQAARPSPFIATPAVTDALMSHKIMKALRRDPVQSRSSLQPASERAEESLQQPLKVLVLTDTNFNFMGPTLRDWGNTQSISLRSRNLAAEGVDPSWWHPRNTIIDRLTGTVPEPPEFLTEDLRWADLVYVEWSQALAARLSGIAHTWPLAVRLHRYEAFIPTPTLTCWDGVDLMLTITPYMRTLLERTIPGIESRTRIALVPNITDLRPFALPKRPNASKTLGLIQYSSVVKDPQWALDILELLLREDSNWKLLLVGSAPDQDAADDHSARYFSEFNQRLSGFGTAVQRLGHRNDLPEVMREIGFVLSTSQVEGAPVSLLEGIASGAVPVIRNWPIVSPLNGAGLLYPDKWIVETPREAALRILSQPQENAADERINWAMQYDSTVTLAQLNRLLFSDLTT